MTDRRNLIGTLVLSIACCLFLACAAKAIGQAEGHAAESSEIVDPAAGYDIATRVLSTRSAGEDSAGALLAIPLAAALQLLVGWVARRPWVRRHMPRAVAFLLRPRFIALGSIIVADLVMLARPLLDGVLTWEIALVAIGAHVGQVMSPTLNLAGAPDAEVRETQAVPA